MRKSFKMVMASMIAILLALAPVIGAGAATYTPGAYTSAAKGMMGDVKVEVTFTDSAIESVAVVEQNETPSIAQAALDVLPGAIVEWQTLTVDGVAGATFTSNAIIAAVTDCVKQAGGDVDALMEKIETDSPVAELKSETLEADVVIVGAGGAGLSAAVAAGEMGAKVIVVEKMAGVGGTTALSSGLVQIAGTQQQADYGITGDSWEIYAEDIFKRGSEKGNKEIIDRICFEANDMMDWLAGHGIAWDAKLQEKHGEDVTFLRTHAPVAPEGFAGGALGAVFTDALAEELEKYDGTILFSTKANKVVKEDGTVTGIVAVNEEAGIEYTIQAKAVILATGGFAANSEMANKYLPTFPADNGDYRAFPGSLGEGVVMGEEAGAALVDMDQMKILISSTGFTAAMNNAIYANREGKRFVAEDAKTEVLADALLEQTGDQCYMIYDSRTVGDETEKVKGMVESGDMVMGETVDALAANLGMDAAALNESIKAFNAVVKGEAQDEFGRVKFGNTIEEGPFYATERHTRLHYTMGGLKIDKNAHVIDTQGAVIPGFYAAGEVTGGVHGSYRVGANALSEILVMGRAAGESAVSDLGK